MCLYSSVKSAQSMVKTCLQYVFSHRISLVIVFFYSGALIVVCIFKSRNNLTDFLREVTGEGMWFVCFLLRLLQSLLPTAHRRRTLLVNTLLVRSGKSFILSTNLRSVRLVSFLPFFFSGGFAPFLCWWTCKGVCWTGSQ